MPERISPQIQRKDLHLPTLEEARKILGGKLPSILEKYDFPEPGIIITEQGPKVAVYAASGEGFSWLRNQRLVDYVYPNLESRGAFVLCPFTACGEFVRPEFFDKNRSVAEVEADWAWFNNVVVDTVNYKLLIPRSCFAFAVLEGSPSDDGVAAEAAYIATNFSSMVGVRSDFHLNENIATGINPAVRVFMSDLYGGSYYEGIREEPYVKAFADAAARIQRRLQRTLS